MVEIFLNDKYIGECENSKNFVKGFIEKRRQGEIENEFNIKYDEEFENIIIDSTPGRLRRPLIIVSKGVSKLTKDILKLLKDGKINFDDLIKKGIIEYIDALEEENLYVASEEKELNLEHSHLEIHPSIIFGQNCSTLPFCDLNDASRLLRGQKTLKQAVGLYSSNLLNRNETDRVSSVYMQKPLNKTFSYEIFDYEKHSAGQNAIVALMSYEGYNMEDGVILNQSSIDRGFQRSYYYKIYETKEIKYPGGLFDTIGMVSKDVKGYRLDEDYRLLEDDGIVGIEEYVRTSDVIIGKTSPPKFVEEIEGLGQMININIDSSITLKEDEKGTISSVFLIEDQDGDKKVSTLIRDLRIPIVGDKFASRHGQKGVIGATFKQSDMPFTKTGIVPDLVLSPHSVPGRKTVGHVLEILTGKLAAVRGKEIDATSFDSENEKDLREELKKYGFKENGCEEMYDPKTGKKLKAEIYVGSIYYLRLKHQVENKIQARGIGPVQLLTRQPAEGRNRGGGLKLGEMEKDAIISHGASLLLKERFSSDQTKAFITENEGYMIDPYFYNYASKFAIDGSTRFDKIELSYVFKLFMNHLKSMGVKPTFKVKDRFFDKEDEMEVEN